MAALKTRSAAVVLSIWILLKALHIRAQCLYKSNSECGSQAVDLGYFPDAESCGQQATTEAQCGEFFMFSSDYPSWGCRCCSPDGGELGGASHALWDLYSVEECGTINQPASLPGRKVCSCPTCSGMGDFDPNFWREEGAGR